MKLRTKAVIFLVALLLTFAGFNTIASSSKAVDLLKVGKKAGYNIIANFLAKADTNTARSVVIKG